MYDKFEGIDYEKASDYVAKEEVKSTSRKSKLNELLPLETSVKDNQSLHLQDDNNGNSDTNSKKNQSVRKSKTSYELAPITKSLTYNAEDHIKEESKREEEEIGRPPYTSEDDIEDIPNSPFKESSAKKENSPFKAVLESRKKTIPKLATNSKNIS